MKILSCGFVTPFLLIVVALLALGGGAYYYVQKQNAPQSVAPMTATPTTATSTTVQDETANWKTYTNDQYGFSLQYPISLNAEFEKNYNDGTVWFRSGSRASFYIYIQTANQAWPNLTAFLNDQFLASKGGSEPAPVIKTLSSGIQLRDVGRDAEAHKFVGQLDSTHFVVFSFVDESLIERVLTSFSPRG